jgi:hypothetical protein
MQRKVKKQVKKKDIQPKELKLKLFSKRNTKRQQDEKIQIIKKRDKPKKQKKPKKPIVFRGIVIRHPNKERLSKAKKAILGLILVLMLLYGSQYAFLKWQMTRYDEINYSCVGMSYDAEQFFESIGIHTVERRVVGEHRWVAIELFGNYIEFETTMNLFFFHIVTPGMEGQPIEQSEGFFQDGKAIVQVHSNYELHINLKDWKVICVENGTYNSWILNLFP